MIAPLDPKITQVPVDQPDYGALIPDANPPFQDRFRLDQGTANHSYDGHFLIVYTGTKAHKPVARFLSLDSECDMENIQIQYPLGQQTIISLTSHGRNPKPQPWYQSSLAIQSATYAISGIADYNNGGAGPDSGVLLTGRIYRNGFYLKLECDDYGGGRIPPHPDFDFNDKIVEIFFPLSYGIDFKSVTLTPSPYPAKPTQITIS
jgi:hypothetical protein